jgi:VIT1/CCC1 family predicted Fe2+/Mn2+ transporter
MRAIVTPFHRARQTLEAGSIREVVFGVEDGVVQNMILVAGMVGAQLSFRLILFVGGVNAIAGVLAMSMGTYLSSKAERDVSRATGDTSQSARSPARDATVMAGAYAVGAAIPLVPFVFGSANVAGTLVGAIGLTMAALFALGFGKAVLSHERRTKAALEMLLLASLAGVAGYGVGALAESLFDM